MPLCQLPRRKLESVTRWRLLMDCSEVLTPCFTTLTFTHSPPGAPMQGRLCSNSGPGTAPTKNQALLGVQLQQLPFGTCEKSHWLFPTPRCCPIEFYSEFLAPELTMLLRSCGTSILHTCYGQFFLELTLDILCSSLSIARPSRICETQGTKDGSTLTARHACRWHMLATSYH
jgi:hypothetical protein